MKFIKLNSMETRRAVFVNISQIRCYGLQTKGVSSYVVHGNGDDGTSVVAESPEQITQLIKEASNEI